MKRTARGQANIGDVSRSHERQEKIRRAGDGKLLRRAGESGRTIKKGESAVGYLRENKPR